MSTLFAFLHHIAAFALFATLTLEFVLIKSQFSLENARRLVVADMIYGLAAGLIIVVGLLRIFFFEKGAYFYFHSVPFITKLVLFVIVGLLSIYPTRVFLSWRPALKKGDTPTLDGGTLAKIQRVLHLELVGIVFIILCAAMAARGVGQVSAG